MQKEYIGFNSIENLSEITSNSSIKKALLFTGKKSFEKFKDKVASNIKCEFDMHNDFDVNPKYEEVEKALSLFDLSQYQMIIAFGGGSVLDFAKLVKYYGKVELPLVAIPTTAGTGSEATSFAVFYVKGEKQSLDDKALYPDYSIVDGQFLLGSPKYLKACSAADALCQAIESYWAVASTEESKASAKESIILAKDYLVKFVNSDDVEAADKMALSSNLAGKAINFSRTTAAHALCYKLTTDYNLPHGHAVALSMIDLFSANMKIDEATCQDSRGLDYVKANLSEILALLGTDDFGLYWKKLMDDIGLESSFNKLNITTKDEIFKTVNEARLKNNPKNITADLKDFWLS